MKNTLSDKEFIQCAHIEGHDLLSCDGEDWVHFLWRDIVFDKIYEKYYNDGVDYFIILILTFIHKVI